MDIKNVSYNQVLSHTFPGVLLELEIFMAFHLFTPINVIGKLSALAKADVPILISMFVLFCIFATIIGFMLDGIHHCVFRKKENQINGIYKYITNLDRLQIARAMLDDDLWYPYEAYINICLAMVPGVILLPYWMVSNNFNLVFVVSAMLIYFATLYTMYRAAVETLEVYVEVEGELMKAFKQLKQ